MNIDIKWLGSTSFEGVNNNGQKVLISPNPKEYDKISPPDLLLMSLGSCTGLFLMPAAKKLNVEIKDYAINVQGVKSNNPPNLFEKIIVTVKFKGDLSQEQAEEIIEESNKNCFVLHSLNPEIKIESVISVEK